jgi:hypothetical protein
MHLTPKDEDLMLLTVGTVDLHEISSRPAACSSMDQPNSLCEKASMHEKALQRRQLVKWIGR